MDCRLPVALNNSQLTKTLERLGVPPVTLQRTLVLGVGEPVCLELYVRSGQERPKIRVTRVSADGDGRPVARLGQVGLGAVPARQAVERQDLSNFKR